MSEHRATPNQILGAVRTGAIAALYLLLVLEVRQAGHGSFVVLALVSAGTYAIAVVACLLGGQSVFQKLTTIGWATLGLGLNWLLGLACAPL